jgi:hypothetical protein
MGTSVSPWFSGSTGIRLDGTMIHWHHIAATYDAATGQRRIYVVRWCRSTLSDHR